MNCSKMRFAVLPMSAYMQQMHLGRTSFLKPSKSLMCITVHKWTRHSVDCVSPVKRYSRLMPHSSPSSLPSANRQGPSYGKWHSDPSVTPTTDKQSCALQWSCWGCVCAGDLLGYRHWWEPQSLPCIELFVKTVSAVLPSVPSPG